jgi:two-component system, OmpR family, KDP operon response regulator KdpE
MPRSTGRRSGILAALPLVLQVVVVRSLPWKEDHVSTRRLVLVVDDEAWVAKIVAAALADQGFDVEAASGGEEGLALVERLKPDLVLLDVLMPDIDGLAVLRRIRETSSVPVILLTAKGTPGEIAGGLDLGADDYISKPFHPDEVAARIRAVLRRTPIGPVRVVRVADISIDLGRRTVSRGGRRLSLTRTEWLLLQELATHTDRVVLHTQLLTAVWGPQYRSEFNYLRIWVSRLRRKLGVPVGSSGPIRTFQGIGYLLDTRWTPAADAVGPEPAAVEGATATHEPAPAAGDGAEALEVGLPNH